MIQSLTGEKFDIEQSQKNFQHPEGSELNEISELQKIIEAEMMK